MMQDARWVKTHTHTHTHTHTDEWMSGIKIITRLSTEWWSSALCGTQSFSRLDGGFHIQVSIYIYIYIYAMYMYKHLYMCGWDGRVGQRSTASCEILLLFDRSVVSWVPLSGCLGCVAEWGGHVEREDVVVLWICDRVGLWILSGVVVVIWRLWSWSSFGFKAAEDVWIWCEGCFDECLAVLVVWF